jgi:hypothetical protein
MQANDHQPSFMVRSVRPQVQRLSFRRQSLQTAFLTGSVSGMMKLGCMSLSYKDEFAAGKLNLEAFIERAYELDLNE